MSVGGTSECSPEATIALLRGEDNWLAPVLEARINEDCTTSLVLEALYQPVKSPVALLVDGLYARGVIHVSDGRNRGPRHIHTLTQIRIRRHSLFLIRQRPPVLLQHRRNQQHVRGPVLEPEILSGVLSQHARCEGPARLPEFSLEIHRRLHFDVACIP